MMKILIGLVLVCLDLPLVFETTIMGSDLIILVDMFPDVAGFILMIFGHRELSYENDFFYKNIKFSLWCATVAAMIFVMDLVGITASTQGIQAMLMKLLLAVLEPICLFRIVRGIRQVGKDYGVNVKGKLMLWVWIGYTVITTASIFLATYEPGDPLVLLQAALSFAYVALFYRFRNLYEEIRPELPEEEEPSEEE